MVGDNLIKLNFAPGIKAKDINHNFDVVHEWLNRERRRVGGAGIVDGFDLSANLDTFTITVGSGTIVNDAGEEIVIPEKTFLVGPPEYVSRREKFMCPPDRRILREKRGISLIFLILTEQAIFRRPTNSISIVNLNLCVFITRK